MVRFQYPKDLIILFGAVYFGHIMLLLISDTIIDQIPVMHHLCLALGILSLLFIPGILIALLLGLRSFPLIDNLGLFLGLSIGTTMIIGFLINFLYPLLGVPYPLSKFPIIITMSMWITSLLALLYYRERQSHQVDVQILAYIKKCYYNKLLLYLLLVLVIVILGCISVTFYSNNTLLLFGIILIASIPIVFAFWRKVPASNYPTAIGIMSLSLVLQTAFISHFPPRINVDGEFYYLNQVLANGIWDMTLDVGMIGSSNTVLSIVILGPILATFLNTTIFVLYQLIYPAIFAFVPVISYAILSKQLSQRVSFFAVTFLMFNLYFFSEAILLKRQQIALLFFALLVLVLMAEKISKESKSVLLLLISFSLVVSHYSVAFTVLIILLMSQIIYLIEYNICQNKLFWNTLIETHYQGKKLTANMSSKPGLSVVFLVCFITFCISWYLYVSSGIALSKASSAGFNILNNLSLIFDFYYKSSTTKMALGGGFWEATPLSKLYRILQYSAQAFVLFGALTCILRPTGLKKRYIVLSTSALIFLVIAIIVPFMSVYMNVERIHFLTLMLLYPLCLIGASGLWLFGGQLISFGQNLLHIRMGMRTNQYMDKIPITEIFLKSFTLLFLVPFLLFNVGFVYEVEGIVDGKYNLENKIPISDALVFTRLDTDYYSPGEVTAAIWASHMAVKEFTIYSDAWRGYDLISSWSENSDVIYSRSNMPESSYLFLRKWNLQANYIFCLEPNNNELMPVNTSDARFDDRKWGNIYSNGDAKVNVRNIVPRVAF